MSAPHLAPGSTRAEAANEFRVALLPPVMPKALLPWRRVGVRQLSRELRSLAHAGVVLDGPSQILIRDESAEVAPRRNVLLLADASASGFEDRVLPLLEEHGLSVTVCFPVPLLAPTDRGLDRRLLAASQTLPIAIGIRGSAELEQGQEPPERVYSMLMAARRERERALQRPCEVYLFGGRRVTPVAVDLLRRCGFRLLVLRTAGAAPDMLVAEGVGEISAQLGAPAPRPQ